MRKRVVGIILVLFALNLVFMSKAQNVPVLYQTSFMRALQATGAQVSGVYLQGSGELESVWQANMTWPGLCRQLAADCGFADSSIQTAQALWQTNGAFLWKSTDSVQTLHIFFEPNNKGGIVKVKHWRAVAEESDFQQANRQIHEMMKILSATPVIYTCLNGYIDGKLKDNEWKQSMEDGFACVGAEITKRYETPVGFYYCGSVPFLVEDTAGSAARPLDIGLDAHYEAESGRTVYKIGSTALFSLVGAAPTFVQFDRAREDMNGEISDKWW